jgi:IS30 family transposase
MKKAKDLSSAERLEIKILLDKGYSKRSIGKALGRSPNTISYEIKVNSVNGEYDPLKAQAKARLRKRMRKLEWAKINENKDLRAFVIKKLKLHWNPDEIAGYMKKHPRECSWYASKTAIYDWLRTSRGERYCHYLYSKRRHIKKQGPKTERALIPNRVSIDQRFLGADHRSRYGHFEADTVVGRKGTAGGVKTVSERKSRLFLAQKVVSMKPGEHAEVLQTMLAPLKVKSVTFDNGIENREHERLTISTFFADRYSSWQRGGNEHGNKMLRRYFPKGTNFEKISQTKIDQAVSLINNKPRKILGYRSALEVAEKAGILTGLKVGVS